MSILPSVICVLLTLSLSGQNQFPLLKKEKAVKADPDHLRNVVAGADRHRYHPAHRANTGEGGVSVNSRVRSLDAIPFNKSLRFDMESW